MMPFWGSPKFNPCQLFVISVTVDNFPIPKTIRITEKRDHESHWSMEIVDFMENHVYPFWGSKGHLGSIFLTEPIWAKWCEQVLYLLHFCTTHRYRAAAVHKIGDSNPRHTPSGSSKVKVDGTIRKSVYEFLFESCQNEWRRTHRLRDIGGFVVEPFLNALPVA